MRRYLNFPAIGLAAILLAGCGLFPGGATPTPRSPVPTNTPYAASDGGVADTPAPPEPVIATANLSSLPLTLDPALVSNGDFSGNDMVENIFAGLTRLDPETGRIEAALARDWEVSEDGLTWTVHLRDDIFWVYIDPESGEIKQGRSITAEDVVQSVRRVCLRETGAPLASAAYIIKGCRDIHQADPDTLPASPAQAVGVRVLNDVAVEFVLESDPGLFLSLLAMPLMRPVPTDLIEREHETWVNPNKIWASGPYVVQPTIPIEEGYTLVRNPYWPYEFKGNVEAVQIIFAEDGLDIWEEGALDLSVLPDAAAGDDNENYQILGSAQANFLIANYDTPPLDNADLRRALALALDRQAVIAETMLEADRFALPAYTVIPPGMAASPAYGSVGVQFDPAAARTALENAGYPSCDRLPVITLFVNEDPLPAQIGEAIIKSWVTNLNCAPEKFVLTPGTFSETLLIVENLPTGRRESRPGLVMFDWEADYYDMHNWTADIFGCREDFPDAFLNQGRACSEIDNQMLIGSLSYVFDNRYNTSATLIEAIFGPTGEMPLIPVYFEARGVAVQPWLTIYPTTGGPLQFDRWVKVDKE